MTQNRYFLLLIFAIFLGSGSLYSAATPASTVQVNPDESGLLVERGADFPVFTISNTPAESDTQTKAISFAAIDHVEFQQKLEASAQLNMEETLQTNVLQTNLITVQQLGSRPLAYPSPIRSSDSESGVYYTLSSDMNIELRVFDIRGSQIYKKNVNAGAEGGKGNQENVIPLNLQATGFKFPAGTYFFVLISDGRVIGKGKFGALP